MKLNYIPIQPIIAEVQDEFKDLDVQGKLDIDTCYSSAVECIREIGGHQYQRANYVIEVNKQLNSLPMDFYMMHEVWELDTMADPNNEVFDLREAFIRSGPHGPYYRKNTRIYCANQESLKLLGEGDGKKVCDPTSKNWFILKSPPPVIRFAKVGFTAGLLYYGLQRDEKGNVMMQDEVNSIKAVKNFILMTALRPSFISGRLAQYIYQEVKGEYTIYTDQAQAVMKMANTDDYDLEVERVSGT